MSILMSSLKKCKFQASSIQTTHSISIKITYLNENSKRSRDSADKMPAMQGVHLDIKIMKLISIHNLQRLAT